MKRGSKVPPTSRRVSPAAAPGVDERPIVPRRKHPLLLALVAVALACWLAFLAWMAFRG
jgi:hypothetical protein